MSRDPRMYIEDIIDASKRALEFSQGLDLEAYRPGNMAFEAIVGQIEIIGEAAAHLPENIRAQAPSIPWENLSGMRNRLIHGYFAVDPDIVWDVVHHKLPTLLNETRRLLDRVG